LPPEVVFEADVMVEQSACGCSPDLATVELFNPNVGPWGTAYARVTFDCDGKVYGEQRTGDASSKVALVTYSPGRWYHVTVSANFSAKTFDVYLDGVLRGSGLQIRDVDSLPTGVQVDAQHGGYPTAFFDNVKVSAPAVCVP
jgi:hypothetical protein